MSHIADEMEAAAWPSSLCCLVSWEHGNAPSSAQPWQDVRGHYARELLLGDPLPLVALRTLSGQWVVPTTDGTVWWWTQQEKCPDHLPGRETSMPAGFLAKGGA